MPKAGVSLKVAALSQPFWLMALAPCPGLKRTYEYPPNISSLSDEFCAKSEKLAASTNKLATTILRITLYLPKVNRNIVPAWVWSSLESVGGTISQMDKRV
jgi:hypothetical protein